MGVTQSYVTKNNDMFGNANYVSRNKNIKYSIDTNDISSAFPQSYTNLDKNSQFLKKSIYKNDNNFIRLPLNNLSESSESFVSENIKPITKNISKNFNKQPVSYSGKFDSDVIFSDTSPFITSEQLNMIYNNDITSSFDNMPLYGGAKKNKKNKHKKSESSDSLTDSDDNNYDDDDELDIELDDENLDDENLDDDEFDDDEIDDDEFDDDDIDDDSQIKKDKRSKPMETKFSDDSDSEDIKDEDSDKKNKKKNKNKITNHNNIKGKSRNIIDNIVDDNELSLSNSNTSLMSRSVHTSDLNIVSTE